METSDLAGRVRAELARQRKSQLSLQRHLGISRTSLYRRLTGEQPFTSDELVKVAGFLGMTVGELFGEKASA